MSDQTGTMLKAVLRDQGVADGVERILRAVMHAGANDTLRLTKELLQMGPESLAELGFAGNKLAGQVDVILNGVATTSGSRYSVALRDLLPPDGPEHGVQVVDVLRAGVEDGGLVPEDVPDDVEQSREYRIGSTAETIFNLMTGHVPYSEQDRATLARQIATQLEDEGRLR